MAWDSGSYLPPGLHRSPTDAGCGSGSAGALALGAACGGGLGASARGGQWLKSVTTSCIIWEPSSCFADSDSDSMLDTSAWFVNRCAFSTW